MTTIAYKDGFLAADSQCNNGNFKVNYLEKIEENEDFVWASAGTVSSCYQFSLFIQSKPFKEEIFKDERHAGFCCLYYDKKKKELFYIDNDLTPEKLNVEFYAIGSGAYIAYGAMLAGKNAKEAVEIAAKMDNFTGGEIKEIKL